MRDVKQILSETIEVKTRLLNDPEVLAEVEVVIDRMIEVYRLGGRVFFCGNGGSAADAQHFAAELTGHLIFDRPPLAAEALHGNSSHLTAVANDYAYDEVFARALEGSARAGDMLIGLTTSGNSGSIVRAAEVGRALGVFVVAMTGASGGRMRDVSDACIRIPSTDTGRIQESHTTLVHAISEAVEFAIFGHLVGHRHD